MKTAIATTDVLFGTLLGLGPAAIGVVQRSHTDLSPVAFVRDSAITMKIKAKLDAEHIAGWGRIHVNADKNGVVWLNGRRPRTPIDTGRAAGDFQERANWTRITVVHFGARQ